MPHGWSVHDTVATALQTQRSVVALESAFLTHGLPYPANLETAQAMLEAVRAGGSVPAILAVWQGRVCIGLDDKILSRLAETSASGQVRKASRRDLALVVEQGASAGLTVAASLYLAAQMGIRVLATGGLGGVRRSDVAQWDVSADLWELAQQPVAVVCSGAKSLMDAEATWEWLETLGVPVIGWDTSDWPGFVLRSSGLRVLAEAHSAEELARWLCRHWDYGGRGIIVAVAPPIALDPAEHEAALRQAEREAQLQGIHGPHWTPFILRRLAELTGGRSLEANRALLVHNAQRAGQLAQALTATDLVRELS
ncbi:MAG: pseudouridine-5'-phosphate glycosidase [Gemmatales bacterium]|nr:pseudouridine-5'-phosphate glycosidase [Gemmatales bacterium]